ncbi:MAG: phosphoadenylyl-sulfate reductase [Desulfuromonadaceae bacterium]|nr:phosphoadenylyl-sulfate reductase [Desulfuromonadaceae bacterium]
MEHFIDNDDSSLSLESMAVKIITEGLSRAQGNVQLACSFGVEDLVLIDLISRFALEIGVFAIDTGRLPEETYTVAEAVRERYALAIHWFFPDRGAVESLLSEKGSFSFQQSLEKRQECCFIRKVEPLHRALAPLAGWVTGMRREQSVTRATLAAIEIDQAHDDRLKINPLIDWTEKQIWVYADQRRLPVNRLHRQGYPSIGCAPCTRAILPGEDPRAGRWWWENPEHKECGLHRRPVDDATP